MRLGPDVNPHRSTPRRADLSWTDVRLIRPAGLRRFVSFDARCVGGLPGGNSSRGAGVCTDSSDAPGVRSSLASATRRAVPAPLQSTLLAALGRLRKSIVFRTMARLDRDQGPRLAVQLDRRVSRFRPAGVPAPLCARVRADRLISRADTGPVWHLATNLAVIAGVGARTWPVGSRHHLRRTTNRINERHDDPHQRRLPSLRRLGRQEGQQLPWSAAGGPVEHREPAAAADGVPAPVRTDMGPGIAARRKHRARPLRGAPEGTGCRNDRRSRSSCANVRAYKPHVCGWLRAGGGRAER